MIYYFCLKKGRIPFGVKVLISDIKTVALKKLPLGSSAVESLIRQVVNLRMKGNSKFWLQDNAEIMLHLRLSFGFKITQKLCCTSVVNG